MLANESQRAGVRLYPSSMVRKKTGLWVLTEKSRGRDHLGARRLARSKLPAARSEADGNPDSVFG